MQLQSITVTGKDYINKLQLLIKMLVITKGVTSEYFLQVVWWRSALYFLWFVSVFIHLFAL